MPTRPTATPALLASLAAASLTPGALAQSFTTYPRGPTFGISEDGRYAAYSSGNTAYRFDASTGESLRLGPGRVRDMTPDGTAIVGLTSEFRGGFLWTQDGGYVSLTDTVPAFSDGNTRAYAISDDGQSIIGAPFYGEPSFIYRPGGPTTHLPEGGLAPSISGDGTTVPGWISPADGSPDDAAVFDAADGAARVLIPACQCAATVASHDGSILGGFYLSQQRIFRVDEHGDIRFIDMFPRTYLTSFFDMSADGRVLTGTAHRADGAYGWIWTEEGGLRTMNDFLVFEQGFDLAGWHFQSAVVNAAGTTFAGVAFDPDGNDSSYLVTLGPGCVADFDRDGSLTIYDFLTFQNRFQDGDPSADLDGDGMLTVLDFLTFQTAFDTGCE